MAMGPFGVTHGVAALFNTKTGEGQVTSRGLSGSEVEEVRRCLPFISSKYFPREGMPTGSMPRIECFTRESLSDHRLFPLATRVFVFWSLVEDYSGFLGLGQKLSGQPFDEGDRDLLLNLTNVLTGTLSQALSVLSIQQLNADLLKKNAELGDALGDLKKSRVELDRRIFYLKSLSDLNAELSPIVDLDGLLRTFLLTVMGPLGVRQGFVLVFERETQLPKLAARGLNIEPTLDGDACEKLFYRAFEAMQTKSLTPMSVSRLADLTLFGQAGIGIDAAFGLFFLIDQSFMGVVVLGPTHQGASLAADEGDLLATQTSSLMVFLKNARAFQIIQTLNENLTARNEELRRTIEELKEAQLTITLLEKTRARIRSVIQNELERISHANPLDFVLILVMAACIGVLFNFSNPQGVPLLQESVLRPASASVDAQEAKKMLDEENAVLVDARPKELYDQQHLRGALNIPLALFDIMHMMKLGSLDPETPVIVYGRTISRLYDEELAYRLKQRDHDRVVVLPGGLDAWKAYGYPVQ